MIKVQLANARLLKVLAAAALENHAFLDSLLLRLNVSGPLLAPSGEAEEGDRVSAYSLDCVELLEIVSILGCSFRKIAQEGLSALVWHSLGREGIVGELGVNGHSLLREMALS